MKVWYTKLYVYQDSTDEYIATREVGIFSSKEKAIKAIHDIEEIWIEEDTYIIGDYMSYDLDINYIL